jgi:hypothetical protein
MSEIVKVCLVTVLGVGLFLMPVHAQVTNTATPSTAHGNASTAAASSTSIERPKAPERVTATAYADAARQLVEDAKLKAERYLTEQRALTAAAVKATTEEERARIRALIQVKRDAFLAAQRDVREEIHKWAAELRDQLKNHREVLDSAKEQTRERVRQRKGGGD